MTWTLVILFVIISFLIVFRLLTESRKYQNLTYLSKLEQIPSFFDTIQSFDDYVTWIQRDKIKTKYSDIGQYFKGKSGFYKKEGNVKKFNDIFL